MIECKRETGTGGRKTTHIRLELGMFGDEASAMGSIVRKSKSKRKSRQEQDICDYLLRLAKSYASLVDLSDGTIGKSDSPLGRVRDGVPSGV